MSAETNASKLVLVVDDVEDNRLILDRALRSSGYATALAESGQQALSLISSQMPDMVLLDWMMPGLSGLETLRAIRETYPKSKLPVIMCTAIGEEMSVVSAIGEGANDYMVKPISIPILRARMAVHLEQRSVIDTLGSAKEAAERRLSEQTRAYSASAVRGTRQSRNRQWASRHQHCSSGCRWPSPASRRPLPSSPPTGRAGAGSATSEWSRNARSFGSGSAVTHSPA